MSIHPSLNLSEKDKKHRSVLKRTERLKMMLEKGQWKEGDSVFSLPKIKTLRIKIKKEKVEKAETVAPEGLAPAATETKAAEAKGQTAAKATAARSQDKKQ
jgi:small basic protein (TIGR04137 family)